MNEKVKLEIIDWLKAFGFALIVAGVMLIFARPSLVKGQSMMDTFREGDLVLVQRITQFFSDPKRGDIVVAATELKTEKNKKKNIIKRVIGLPGDEIKISEGKVYRNGEELKEDYIYEGSTNGEFEGIVPEDSIFVMGDNRYNSNDSRSSSVGYIAFDKLRGKVYLRLWPLNRIKRF